MYGIVYKKATKNYTKVDTPCENKFKKTQGPKVLLLYVSLMKVTNRSELNLITLLSTRNKTAQIYPHLQTGALISIGQLCDDVCKATFNDTHRKVEKKGDIVLEGTHKGVADMWHVHLATTPQRIPTPTH